MRFSVQSERQLLHLNTYLTVSLMLVQSLDLHELLEVALYCCMDAVSAEADSVLLLDDDKQNFKSEILRNKPTSHKDNQIPWKLILWKGF